MGNWIESAIAFLSPKRGYQREEYRQGLEALRRNYDAGDFGRINAGWNPVNESAEYTDRMSRDVIRARARDLERNSDIINSITGAYKRNIIGGGWNLQARTEQEDLNNQIEKLWKIWCKKKNCDVTETQSFGQIMRMAVERKKIDGAVLFHKVYTSGGILPFKLQMLEVDELDVSRLTPREQGNKVVGGIELNRYNRPVGYWIRQYTFDGLAITDSVYMPAKDIIFYFSKRRPSQIREISDMAQTITRIRDANEFMNAVSVKERILACLSVFIKKVTPQGLGGSERNTGGGKHEYEGQKLAPGMIKYLNTNEEVDVVNPSGQATDATNYTKQQLRLIGAGQGISYESVSRDMSESNYSSARQGMIEDDLTYEEDKELVMEIMDEIYETFLISAVLSGKIQIRDFWENRDIYMAHEWIKAPKPWIDPLKEANANRIAIETGQKTFKEISAENGKDWRSQIDDMEEVIAYARSKGIKMGGVFGEKQ